LADRDLPTSGARETVTGEVVGTDPAELAAVRRVMAQDLEEQARRSAEQRLGVAGMIEAHRALYASMSRR
jgi:hypothetical protein